MNEQLQVALTLTGPVILVMLALTPQVVHLLFSRDFTDTIGILRLQLLGDIFKVASWPLSYLLPSLGQGRLFFSVELSWNAVYIALLSFGLPIVGSMAAGAAYLIAYVVYFVIVLLVVRRISGFSFSTLNRRLFMLFLLCGAAIFWIRRSDGLAMYLLSICIIAASGYYAFVQLSRVIKGLSLSRILKGP